MKANVMVPLEDSESRRDRILPIDRPGWGWVVVFAAAGLFAIHAGGFKCTGVILVEVIERYDGIYSPSTLLWVFTIKYIITGLTGPVVSLLIVKLTHRLTSLIGLSLMSVSWVGLAYSRSMISMIAFHSVAGGIGNGMVGLTCFLVTGQYFKKRKALAVGIVASGSGVGTIVLPYIMRGLYDNFDYTGATLLYGALSLQCMVLAALLRPISFYERLHARELATIGSHEKAAAIKDEPKVVPVLEAKYCEDSPGEDNDHKYLLTGSTEHRERSVSFHHPKKADLSTEEYSFLSQTDISKSQSNIKGSHLAVQRKNNQHLVSMGDLAGSAFFLEEKHDDGTVAVTKIETAASRRDQFSMRVLRLPKFWMIALSLFVYAMGTAVVYSGIPSLGKEQGIPKPKVALMMLLAGGLEVPCRIGNGFLADRHIMTSLNQFSFCLFFAGFMSMLCALISGVPGIALVLIGMSSMGTSIFSLVPLVFEDLVGKENVTSAMGVQLACQACGFIVSSYLAGLVYDTTGSWRMVYYYVAGVMMLGSIVTWPYCFYAKCRTTCKKKKLSFEKEAIKLQS